MLKLVFHILSFLDVSNGFLMFAYGFKSRHMWLYFLSATRRGQNLTYSLFYMYNIIVFSQGPEYYLEVTYPITNILYNIETSFFISSLQDKLYCIVHSLWCLEHLPHIWKTGCSNPSCDTPKLLKLAVIRYTANRSAIGVNVMGLQRCMNLKSNCLRHSSELVWHANESLLLSLATLATWTKT